MNSNSRPSARWLLVPILALASIAAVGIGFGLYFASRGFYAGAPFYWFPFPFFPLIFIPIAVLIFIGARWFWWGCWGRGWGYGQYYDPAEMALRERYAKGEITKEQLDLMTKDLEG